MKPDSAIRPAVTLLLALGIQAHMVLRFPVPFQANNSPLDPSGIDFPCKPNDGTYRPIEVNPWRAGETKLVSFKGSAVHGGGSCQFSLTTDERPTKQSQWKVIHSVVGGCPSNVSENLPADPDGALAAAFPVTLPKDTPNGPVVFAWSWLNKKGNREFYMSCAPLMVSGGVEGRSHAFNRLPDMFVANLPSWSCGTRENFDFAYPNPGNSVVTGSAASVDSHLTGDGCASVTKMGVGAGGAALTLTSQAEVATADAVLRTGGQNTSLRHIQASETTNIRAATTASCAACAEDGMITCIGKTQFALCSNGCAIVQDLAGGTSCSNGVIA